MDALKGMKQAEQQAVIQEDDFAGGSVKMQLFVDGSCPFGGSDHACVARDERETLSSLQVGESAIKFGNADLWTLKILKDGYRSTNILSDLTTPYSP